MTLKRVLSVLMILFIFALQFRVFGASPPSDKDEAAATLVNAENAVASAYNATINAEQVGANVSSLLVGLNDAGDELSKAEIAYRQGDFNSSLSLASSCAQLAEEVKVEADQLRLAAIGSQYDNQRVMVVISIIAMAAVGLGSFWSWRFFKRHYYRRVLQMKPEAVSRES